MKRPRAITIPTGKTGNGVALRVLGPLEVIELESDQERPKTRGDCESGPRPCPYVSCKQHLYLDVNPHTGGLKLNFPGTEVEDMPESCALDVADRGGLTLEAVGEILNLTRERIRQVEVRGLIKLRFAGPGNEQ